MTPYSIIISRARKDSNGRTRKEREKKRRMKKRKQQSNHTKVHQKRNGKQAAIGKKVKPKTCTIRKLKKGKSALLYICCFLIFIVLFFFILFFLRSTFLKRHIGLSASSAGFHFTHTRAKAHAALSLSLWVATQFDRASPSLTSHSSKDDSRHQHIFFMMGNDDGPL